MWREKGSEYQLSRIKMLY